MYRYEYRRIYIFPNHWSIDAADLQSSMIEPSMTQSRRHKLYPVCSSASEIMYAIWYPKLTAFPYRDDICKLDVWYGTLPCPWASEVSYAQTQG